jgi:hypothetical protein
MNRPEWVLQRLLAFLNRMRSADDLLNAPELRDDPDSGAEKGYLIGKKVAQHILEHRSSLPGRRYREEADILGVAGLGRDKLNDLLHSFSTPADDDFVNRLFDGILYDNWELRPFVRSYDSTAALRQVADGLDRFRLTVGELVAQQHGWSPAEREIGLRSLRQAYVASYPEAHLGSYPFAFWWYQFDQDNWFSFETMRGACERYLNHHASSPEGMQFRLLQLYNDTPANLVGRREMLPVVVNYAEAKITYWTAVLND